MIVSCENCGKQYKIDPQIIKRDKFIYACRACSHKNTIRKPSREGPNEPDLTQPLKVTPMKKAVPIYETEAESSKGNYSHTYTERRFGLRLKMFTLFLIIPIIVIAASGALYLREFQNLSAIHIDVSAKVIKQMAKYIIMEKARAVAKQGKVYFETHPGLRLDDLKNDANLRVLVLEGVGKTGSTFLYSIAADQKPMQIRLHPDEKLIGASYAETIKQELSDTFENFKTIIKYPEEGKNIESAGSYFTKDEKGREREKYIFLSPLEGMNYGIAATTYLDEFTGLTNVMEARSKKMSLGVRNSIIGTVIGTLVLIGLIVFFYGHRLTSRIRSLTRLADRISVGDMETSINIKSKDEIEDLADAIARMQDSIRLSLERMRR